MTEIKLYKSPLKAIRFLLLTLPFVLVGIWLIYEGNSGLKDWFLVCFFGLGIPLSLFHLFDRRPQIIINEEGIWDRSTKQDLIKWELIQNAYPVSIYGQKFISLKLDKNFEAKIKQYKWATWLSRSVGAQKLNLHLGQIKVDVEKLAQLIKKMNKLIPEERGKIIINFAQQQNIARAVTALRKETTKL